MIDVISSITHVCNWLLIACPREARNTYYNYISVNRITSKLPNYRELMLTSLDVYLMFVVYFP